MAARALSLLFSPFGKRRDVARALVLDGLLAASLEEAEGGVSADALRAAGVLLNCTAERQAARSLVNTTCPEKCFTVLTRAVDGGDVHLLGLVLSGRRL